MHRYKQINSMSTLTNVRVPRNNVEVEFVPTEVKKGTSKGKVFLGPSDVTKDNLPAWLEWLGGDIVSQIISAVLRQRAKGWSDEAEDESATAKDGDKIISFDPDKYVDIFTHMASEFNLRGESIPELNAQIKALTEQFTELNFAAPDAMAKAASFADQIKALQIAIASKRRKNTEEEEVASTK